MLLTGERRLWAAPDCGYPQQQNVSVARPELRTLSGQKKFPDTRSYIPAILGSPSQPEIAWEVFTRKGPGYFQREREEFLWREFFLDPTVWWDNRQDKKTSRSPDFRHKKSKEVLWLNSFYKPAWVELQLATLDDQLEVKIQVPPASAPNPTWRTAGRYDGDVLVEACCKLCDKGQLLEAVDVLSLLVHTGFRVSTCVFYCVLKECLAQRNLVLGRRVHGLVVQGGYHSNTLVANQILRIYTSHGRLQEAADVFAGVAKPDPYMWTSMISALDDHGEPQRAIELYHRMCSSGVKPDSHVFVATLKACAGASDLKSGRQVHTNVLKSGLQSDFFVSSCLVDMYAKCGRLEDARTIFDSLALRDLVTWTTMIAGYAEHGLGQEALALYASMKQEDTFVADNVTFACLLKACASIGAIQQGKQLHSEILKRGLETDLVVGSCLVDMYAQCGCLKDARRVFDKLPKKNVITWTVMLNGLGRCNEGQAAIELFEEMLRQGVRPDETTFVCLLVACSQDGLVNEGRQYFNAMVEDYSIVPTRQHYVCMVDLLGRSGHVDDAEALLLSMPFESHAAGWMSLLNACKGHGNMACGRRCFENLVTLDSQDAGAYVIMAKIYADAGRWADVDMIESLRKSVGARKKPAKAGIEVNRQLHTFFVGEERVDTFPKLRSMNVQLEEGGHVPHTELVLKPISQKEKEDELCGHAEKIALAYGLLNTPNGTSLLVTKNLRMCTDCHSATQVLSRIEKREIIVRDANRVHRFLEGHCSCDDRP